MPELKEPVFKDIPLSFTAHPITGNVKALVNRDAVKQSVKNIVLTNFYERPYNATLGGDILSQLFENMDTITEYNVAKNIRQALDNYEPRAIIDDIKSDFNQDGNAVNVTIIFRIENDANPISVNVLLDRVR
jgi:phage baseplate assembly protein W|tara:strand:- start:177 stop:572 length:396 start_codon:yes stop_codon:yes gene_type:complete